MSARPAISGYRARRLLGVGPSGEVWAADGPRGVVAVRLLRPAVALHVEQRYADPAWAAWRGPHCIAMHGLVPAGRGVGLVSELAPGGPLAGHGTGVGSLRPADLLPAVRTVAAAHASGWAHGALTPTNLLVGVDGVVRVDPDVSRLLGALAGVAHRRPYVFDEPPSVAGDLRALRLVCAAVFGAAAEWAAAGSAAELAEMLAGLPAGAAAPLSAPLPLPAAVRPGGADRRGAAPVPRPRPATHRRAASRRALRGSRLALLALTAVTALCCLLAAARQGGGGRPGQGASAARGVSVRAATGAARRATPGTSSWLVVVRRLEAARARALRLLDVAALSAVYVAGSPAWPEDAARIDALRARGAVAVRGFAGRVLAVRLRRVAGGVAELTVTDRLDPYAVLDATARVLHAFPGRGPRTFLVTLHRGMGGRWLVQSWRPAGET